MPSRRTDPREDSLTEFIDEIAGPNQLRVEEDFGQGFVRLRSSEAERRQAAQDIRSSEDVIVELLRNSRDAGATNIYVATGKVADVRTFVVIDDGQGIPLEMRELIFEPRITSKLDSAHMDKWGLHGRGMALFSIAENSLDHKVVYSSLGNGTSIMTALSMNDVNEKKDQSTFPYFEIDDGTFLMRGPKNIQRVICEFAIESRREVDVYLGSYTEIAATLFKNGLSQVPAKTRIFEKNVALESPSEMMSVASDPSMFKDIAFELGLDISNRSARRVLDGQILPVPTILSRIENAIRADGEDNGAESVSHTIQPDTKTYNPHITNADLKDFESSIKTAFYELSEKYYMRRVDPRISIRRGKLNIEFDVLEDDGE